MEFDVFTTTVQLQDIPSYTTNIILEGQLLRLSLLWNERVGKRVLSIKNSNDEYYLQNTILHPNEPFELNSNAVFDDLPYKVILQKVGDPKKVGNIYNWSKDFILCFYRTVDIETEKLNVKYGVTAPSTPTLPKPFGNWILNQGYELVNEDIRYTAYKTNGVSYYDSFANFNLVTALVRSFHDSDLQQYVAFTTAVEQLIGAVDWVLDLANNQIKYIDPNAPTDPNSPALQYYYFVDLWEMNKKFSSVNEACIFVFKTAGWAGDVPPIPSGYGCNLEGNRITAYSPSGSFGTFGSRRNNPAYDPTAEDNREKTIPLETVAQKVISNAESSPDEILKLLSQDYINLVAESIFAVNASKQFVKLEDLIPQLEANKVLR